MTGINNSSMDLVNVQFTTRTSKDDKPVDDLEGFKAMLKGKDQEREETETPDAKDDLEPAIEAVAAAMEPVSPQTQPVEVPEETPDQELVVKVLLPEAGEGMVRDARLTSADQKSDPIYHTLDQLRLQQMLAKTGDQVRPESEQSQEIVTEPAKEPVIIQASEEPIKGKKEEALPDMPENNFLPHMEKTLKKAVQPLEKEEPVSVIPQTEQPVERFNAGMEQTAGENLNEQVKLTPASGHKTEVRTEGKPEPAKNEEKTPEQPINAFQEKPSEPVHVRTSKEKVVYTTVKADSRETLETKLPEHILRQIKTGKNELNVQLEPGNLGKIQIKVSYEDNHVSVSVLCTESKTLRMLSQSAGDIGAILEANLERPVQILVDKQENDYLNNQEQRDQGRQQQEQGNRRQQEQSSEDFLQKLRLGIVDAEAGSYDFADYR